MPMPVLASASPSPRGSVLSRTQAAARLGINGPGLDKLVRAGMLPSPLQAAAVDKLAGRDRLRLLDGELTVLRLDARTEADPRKHPGDPRKWAGFHVDHTDKELEESSLRWWRADADRVLDNQMLAVTVATFPVALYRITEKVTSQQRLDEPWDRHRFGGDLLARVLPGMAVVCCGPALLSGRADTVDDEIDEVEVLGELAERIMATRIVVDSGGPIGYLEPDR